MLITLGILMISVVIILIELPKLKKGGTKIVWTFSILLVLGTSLNIAIGLNTLIVSPLDPIINIFQPFSDFLKETFLNKNKL